MTKQFEISGIAVFADPSQWQRVLADLRKVPGLDTHQQDPADGRLVITLEGTSIEQQQQTLRHIQGLPGIRAAELVYHYSEDEETKHGTQADSRRMP